MRVLMIGGHPFCENWFEASRLVTDATYIRTVGALNNIAPTPGFKRVAEMHLLSQDPTDGSIFEFEAPAPHIPYKFAGRLADRQRVSATVEAIQYLQNTSGQVDCIHGHFGSTRIFPDLKTRLHIPYVISEHSSRLTGASPEGQMSRTGMRAVRRAYGRAAYVLPVSHFLRSSIERLALPGRFEVVENPVDPRRFRRGTEYHGGDFRLLCVARLTPVKALDVLVQAMARVVQSAPHVRLTVVGAGPDEAKLLNLTRSLSLEQRIEFVGHEPNEIVPQYLAGAHAFVLPSLVENLSIATIEALFTGLPVVSTRAGGQPELVGPGDGTLVSPRDEAQLASAILEIATGRLRFDCDAIARRARSRFSLDVIATKLAHIYSETIGGSA
jgi:glycosyltransferase involved in cell wall biosynthesis